MSNEITINITASGEDALKVLKALSTLSGVEVTTSTNTSPLALPVKVKKNLGGRPGKTGVFKSKADLHTFFYNHCAAGKMAFYTTNEVARNADSKFALSLDELPGEKEAVTWGVFPLMGEDALYIRWNGGGGYGDPLERDPQAVLDDVLAGVVSLDSARRLYGVAFVDGDNSVDASKTEALRKELTAARLTQEAAE